MAADRPDAQSLGEAAKKARIGGVEVTFRFPGPVAAKGGWEAVVEQCDVGIGAYRWRLDRERPDGEQAVTVLADDTPSLRATLKQASELLFAAGGTRIDCPDEALHAMRAYRARTARSARLLVRSPHGFDIDRDGRHVGPGRQPGVG